MNSNYDALGFKPAKDWIDLSYKAQERAAKLGGSYFKAFQEGQKTSFDLMQGWLKQMHELQSLSFGYFQDWLEPVTRFFQPLSTLRMR